MGIIFVSCKWCVDHNHYLIKDMADKTLEMALVLLVEEDLLVLHFHLSSHALICKTEQSMSDLSPANPTPI